MENLGWGLQMTALGMGLVFALLALLWGLLALVLLFDRAPVDAQVADDESAAGAGVTARAAGELDADLLAAIVVATLTHKSVRRQEAAPMMRSYWPGSLLFASRWVATGRARQNRTWQRKGK
ncbi:MAG: OadG family transporter subunit [Betaproteobacteria bacterium]